MAATRCLPLLWCAIAATAAGCTPEGDALRVLSGTAMGSVWEVKWHGSASPPAVTEAVHAELGAADRTFSTWGADSELSRFNAHRSTTPFPASELLRRAVALGLQLAEISDGAFDPTVKPLTDLYRAAKAAPTATFDSAALAAARARVGWRHLHIVSTGLVKDHAELELSLDGLVAGLTADRMGERLRTLGVTGYMLQITGEVLCHGCKPDGSPWRIGIVDPEASEPGHEASMLIVPLLDNALCTSGDYRNFVVQDGKVRGHIFDPRTGDAPAHGVVSVSVLARSCALADGLGTALFVAGPADAAAMLRRSAEPDASAWFVIADADGTLRSAAIGWPEAFALDGRRLSAPEPPAAERALAEAALATAAAASPRSPGDFAAAIGRCFAPFHRYRDALATYSRALELHPDEPHLLRDRGQCWITLRDFAADEQDLARAAAVLRGGPDDSQPERVASPPTPGTLQFQVHHHLGLARFFAGNFAGAEVAFRDGLAAARNDEQSVAATQWLWCTLMRLGRRADTGPLLAAIGAGMDGVANQTDFQLCRLYRGDLGAAGLGAAAASNPELAFGLAHYELVLGDRTKAEAALRQLAHAEAWWALGVIGAEVELQRPSTQ